MEADMLRWLVFLMCLCTCSNVWSHGVSIDGLVLGGEIPKASLLSCLPPHGEKSVASHSCCMPVNFLGIQSRAYVLVDPAARIQKIEIRLPLTVLDKAKNYLIQEFGHPKSDSASSSSHGLAAWERRDRETVIGLFSEPEHGATLLVVFIWIPSTASHG